MDDQTKRGVRFVAALVNVNVNVDVNVNVNREAVLYCRVEYSNGQCSAEQSLGKVDREGRQQGREED